MSSAQSLLRYQALVDRERFLRDSIEAIESRLGSDPEVDLDICRGQAIEYPIRYFMKNSFGFGGINCVSILGRYQGEGARA